jgi:voltage-gated potassium channel
MLYTLNKMARTGRLYTTDTYGVREYHFWLLLIMSVAVMVSLSLGLGYLTLQAELLAPDANVKTYRDAVWLMLTSSSTIGFGEVYPVTDTGRMCVMTMFILGVGILSGIGFMVASKMLGFADTNVKNRELRKQNAEILETVGLLAIQVDKLVQLHFNQADKAEIAQTLQRTKDKA